MEAEELIESTSELMKKHQWSTVLKILDKKTLEHHNQWKLYWNAGWSKYKLEKYNEALQEFVKAQKLAKTKKDLAICFTFRGIVELQLDNLEPSNEILIKALNLMDSSLTRKVLSLNFMYLGDPNSAEKVHKEGLKIKPDSKERLTTYADFLIDMGRNEEAKEILERIENL